MLNAYNTKVEGVMRHQAFHLLLILLFVLAPDRGQADVAAARPSLAIMDFTNQNLDDPVWQWLGKGLADMLTTDLACDTQVPGGDRSRWHRSL